MEFELFFQFQSRFGFKFYLISFHFIHPLSFWGNIAYLFNITLFKRHYTRWGSLGIYPPISPSPWGSLGIYHGAGRSGCRIPKGKGRRIPHEVLQQPSVLSGQRLTSPTPAICRRSLSAFHPAPSRCGRSCTGRSAPAPHRSAACSSSRRGSAPSACNQPVR